jgi:hypothetical protein
MPEFVPYKAEILGRPKHMWINRDTKQEHFTPVEQVLDNGTWQQVYVRREP